MKEKQSEVESKEEIAVLKKWTELNNQELKLKKELKEKEAELDEIEKGKVVVGHLRSMEFPVWISQIP